MFSARSAAPALRAAARASSSRSSARLAVRSLSSTPRRSQEAAAAPAANPKLDGIVDQIAGLTLLEAADLVALLKTRLNIQEIAMPAAGAAAAAPAAAAEAPAEEKPKEKTIFAVKLEKIDPAAKAKIIREVKAIMPNMNLVEAKKFVESAPQVLKDNLPKEDAEKLKKTLEAAGATVVLE